MIDALGAALAAAWLWLKAAHIVFVIAWMAGLLYLPRLFVYHCGVAPGSGNGEVFKVMEQRLFRWIMTPAMLGAWALGALLFAASPGALLETGWFPVKFALVLAMTGLHGFMGRWRREFAADRNRRSSGFYRLVNEAPALLMVLIVVLAVVKPF